jgi:Transglutaminase-like superfamily
MPIAFPPTMYRAPLLSGDAGVEQTIQQIRGLVDEALRDPQIIRTATDIVRGVPAFDDYAEARALYDWVHRNIRFTKDPVNKEKLYPPAELLKIRAGDCDDISMLLGTFLMAVGYPARLVTVAAVESAPDQFSHVYVEGQINGAWIPMDPARYDSEFGVAPPQVFRARWWSLVDESYGNLGGCSAAQFMPAMSGLGHYPRFKSHLGSYGKVRTVSGLGSPPDQSAVQDLVNNGYNPAAINQLISLGASNEQLQALPFPASAAEMQSAVNALIAQLGGSPTATAAAPTNSAASGANTSAQIATIAQGGAALIRAAAGQPASPFDFSASGPWSSFQTAYSPYGTSAGYLSAPGITASLPGGSGTWIAIGIGVLLLASMAGGRK